jgi:endonuclease/exonuclease/phosphatase family metal-dependent hydrolase
VSPVHQRGGQLSVASYNIHGGRGPHFKYDIGRVAEVIQELDADIVALQEVDSRRHPGGGRSQLEYLARATGMHPVHGPTICHGHGDYGNAVLTRLDVDSYACLDLTEGPREPRGAIDLRLRSPHGNVRLIATHLGLSRPERHRQTERLASLVAEEEGLLILVGDTNCWEPASGGIKRLESVLPRIRPVRTFPSWLPMLAIDRVWVKPGHALKQLRTHTTSASRRASDHLPLKAVVEVPPRAVEPAAFPAAAWSMVAAAQPAL